MFLLCCAFLVFGKAYAVEFEVYQSSYKPLNLAFLIASQDGYASQVKQLNKTIVQDLDASRSFKSLDPLSYLVSAQDALKHIDYADWRIIGVDLVVVASLHKQEHGWVADIQIHNPFSEKLLVQQNIEQHDESIGRDFAHRIADYIYHQQTGLPSYFTSQIVFTHKNKTTTDLMMMDHDGENLQAVGKGFDLLLSPDLSPNRKTIVLNTYVNSRPRLEFFTIQGGSRKSFAQFKGLNSTPEFSPDGKLVAAALSYTGNSEIHIYDIENKKWKQFTHNKGIDTTPTWSPDGKWIAFTSNRNGTPQIYRKSVATGEVKRISLEANYNTSPVWAPIGDRIAFVTKKDWEYAVATVHIDGTGLRYLATGQRIESPTWSPNGQMLLYSAEEYKKKHIYNVPVWGGEAKRITPRNMDASDPTWSR
ncbi:MAG: DPP IV N-terminal domain-containing protein [Ghiorsea sp.]